MRKIFVLLIFCIFLTACNKKTIAKENGMIELFPQGKIKYLLDSLINTSENKDDCYHEVFIYNTMPCKTEILLHKGVTSRVGQKFITPVSYTTIKGIKFNIYTGVENYFASANVLNEVPLNLKANDKSSADSDNDILWLMTDSCGQISVVDVSPSIKKFIPSN